MLGFFIEAGFEGREISDVVIEDVTLHSSTISSAPSPGTDPGIEEYVDFRDMDGLVVVNVEFNRLCMFPAGVSLTFRIIFSKSA